jgi:uncharacterized protein
MQLITSPDPRPILEAPATEGTKALLIVDSPNINSVARRLLGRIPQRGERFNPSSLAAWAHRYTAAERVECTLFTNIPDPIPPGVAGWINHLLDNDWRVFARPKINADDDIDEAMITHLQSRQWDSVVVFSHDSQRFAGPLAELGRSGALVTVVGFRECAGQLAHLEALDFVDVEQIPDLYPIRYPRLRLAGLPVDGGWVHREVR